MTILGSVPVTSYDPIYDAGDASTQALQHTRPALSLRRDVLPPRIAVQPLLPSTVPTSTGVLPAAILRK